MLEYAEEIWKKTGGHGGPCGDRKDITEEAAAGGKSDLSISTFLPACDAETVKKMAVTEGWCFGPDSTSGRTSLGRAVQTAAGARKQGEAGALRTTGEIIQHVSMRGFTLLVGVPGLLLSDRRTPGDTAERFLPGLGLETCPVRNGTGQHVLRRSWPGMTACRWTR